MSVVGFKPMGAGASNPAATDGENAVCVHGQDFWTKDAAPSLKLEIASKLVSSAVLKIVPVGVKRGIRYELLRQKKVGDKRSEWNCCSRGALDQQAVFVSATGLSPNAVYHFRVRVCGGSFGPILEVVTPKEFKV